eukprot:5613515-Pleurochrysis_carterae.AAC.1
MGTRLLHAHLWRAVQAERQALEGGLSHNARHHSRDTVGCLSSSSHAPLKQSRRQSRSNEEAEKVSRAVVDAFVSGTTVTRLSGSPREATGVARGPITVTATQRSFEQSRSESVVWTDSVEPRTPELACSTYSDSLRDHHQSYRPGRAGPGADDFIQIQTVGGLGAGAGARAGARLCGGSGSGALRLGLPWAQQEL